MRTLYLMVVVCCGACGGRTVGDWDYANAQGGSNDTAGGNEAAGASSVTLGGSGATTGTTGGKGGSGAKAGTGGAKASTGGAKASTGGAKASTGGAKASTGGAKASTGGTTTSATGGKGGSGATTTSTGGKGGSGATTSATGGKGGSGATTGGSVGSGGTGGTGGSGAAGGTGGGAGTSSITSCNDVFPFLGTWEGNILDFYFVPMVALKLVLSADSTGTITGKLTWGEGEPPPAPQGADIPYPPGYWEQQPGHLGGYIAPDPWPGFAYTLVRGAGCDTTFRFGVSTSELWQDWCALQTAVYSDGFGWGCTILGGGGSSDGTSCTIYAQNGQSQTYPMWKCNACGSFGINGGVCACDQNGCFANATATQTFDLTYSVSGATDILSGPDPSCGDCTVRLARTSN